MKKRVKIQLVQGGKWLSGILTDEYSKMMFDFLRPKIVKSPPPPKSCPGEIIVIVKGEKRARRPVDIWRTKIDGKDFKFN